MATQPPAPRQWFRLPSIVRGPSPPPAPTPEAPAPQPRPLMVQAPFRPMAMSQPQQTQPRESTPPPVPAFGASSVPTSPITRTSVPPSPSPKTSPPPTMLPATSSPPKPQVSAPSSSLPTSPLLKPPASSPKPSTFLAPTSPPKLAPTNYSVQNSPPKPAPSRFLAPASPPKPAPTNFYVQNSPPKPEPAVTATTHVPNPTPSPRTIKPADKTPPQSPYNKPTAPPPSPLILPSPQLKSKPELEPTIPTETEQKTVMVQTTSEKPKSWLNGTGNYNDFEETHNRSSSHAHHGNHELHKDVAKKEKGHHKKFSSDSDHEVGMRVLTIAGENKGAFMEVIKSPLKHSFDGNSHTLHKTESDGTGWKIFSRSSSSSDEGKSKKDKNHKAKAHSPSVGTFMNSNVQSVNNSIVFHSSCSHHDPGVHLSFSRKPSGDGFHVNDKSNGAHHS